MTKLLQNKAVVSCLVVAAAFAVAANFVELPKRRTLAAAARSPSPAPPANPDQEFIPPPLRVAAALAAWRELLPADGLRRDPFALAGVGPVNKPATNAPFSSFTLQAVSIADQRAFAVINQTVVAEGEWLGGWQIEKIEPTQVRLRGRLGPMTVELDRSGRRHKESTGKAAAADLRSGSPVRSGGPNH
jgi:hypothetical protein